VVECVFEEPSVNQSTPFAVSVCESVLYSPKSTSWIVLCVSSWGGVGAARVSTTRLSLGTTCMA
jgi:hypothetical protein